MHTNLLRNIGEVARKFTLISFTSFGGTAANILYTRRVFVESHNPWLDRQTFDDLFTLGSALPGPSFIQLAFSIALLKGGIVCGILAVIILAAPGAIGMFALAMGVRRFPPVLPSAVNALFSGLNCSAVGLIAVAGYNLATSAAKTPLTKIIVRPVVLVAEVFVTGAIATCYTALWLFPLLVVVSGFTTWGWDVVSLKIRARRARLQQGGDIPLQHPEAPAADAEIPPHCPPAQPPPSESGDEKNTGNDTEAQSSHREHSSSAPKDFGISVRAGLIVLVSTVSAVVALVIVRARIQSPKPLSLVTNFIIAGTITVGGGPVVVPLLKEYTVDPGWVTAHDFLLGFAILQAFPGPVFNLAVYLGALALPSSPFLGGFLGFIGIYTPGILLKLAVLPLYSRFASHQPSRSVLKGFNAAAVGFLWGTLYRLWHVGFLKDDGGSSSLDGDPWWIVVAAGAFVGCQWFRLEPFVVVMGGATAGVLWWAVTKT
ncbi:hypothetical protein BOTBODRAFT_168807 [Botryobasidium botryosum FD-172 SS1]|uniref:Chromate transporter n=1 Tax=Botryobasidium botryosum (strain FD-172 SS1) TaxID=930990 RepID=A0A067N119_BOTB1|nr:hypothetical protein BOTBODRAFT_168807 [Botryobasidium botryosum FD-172 SS1]